MRQVKVMSATSTPEEINKYISEQRRNTASDRIKGIEKLEMVNDFLFIYYDDGADILKIEKE